MSDYELRRAIINDWFVDGVHRGARYMIIVFDKNELEERPIFVFPEQNIQKEVVKQIENVSVDIKAVMDLLDDIDRQILSIIIPEDILVSKVVN